MWRTEFVMQTDVTTSNQSLDIIFIVVVVFGKNKFSFKSREFCSDSNNLFMEKFIQHISECRLS